MIPQLSGGMLQQNLNDIIGFESTPTKYVSPNKMENQQMQYEFSKLSNLPTQTALMSAVTKPRKKLFIARKVRASCVLGEKSGQLTAETVQGGGELDSFNEIKVPKSYSHLSDIHKLNESVDLEGNKLNADIGISSQILNLSVSQPHASLTQNNQGENSPLPSKSVSRINSPQKVATAVKQSDAKLRSNSSGIIDESFESQRLDQNIFLKQNVGSNAMQQWSNGDVGPQYDKQGNLVPRSIVGKPEWFLKNSSSKLTKEDLKLLSSKKSRFQTNQSISVQSKNIKSSKSLSKIANVKITKFQLEHQLEQIRQRIKNNSENDQKAIGDLQTTDFIRYTQQARNIQKYSQIEREWINFIDQSSSKLNRDFGSSVLLKSDYYRQVKNHYL